MHLAMKIAVDRPTCPKEARSCANLVQALDDLMTSNEIEPVTWIASEDEDKLFFEAFVPADCLPELDIVADYLAECYSGFNQSTE